MYNEQRKENFIEETITNNKTKEYTRSIFKSFTPFEEELQCDLCEQSTEQLQSVIDSKLGLRITSEARAVKTIKAYIEWCKKKGYKVSDGIYGVKFDGFSLIREQMIASPEHLQEVLDQMFNDEDLLTVDCIYRAYLWMLYAGIKDAEALKVTVDEVDLDKLIIRHKNKLYKIYEESKKTFDQACNLKEFRHWHSLYKSDLFKPRFIGDKVIRGLKSNGIKLTTLRSLITKKANGIRKISYKKIYYSGLFYREYECEKHHYRTYFKDYIANQLTENNYTFDVNRTANKVGNEMQRALEFDYRRWKKAFNYN